MGFSSVRYGIDVRKDFLNPKSVNNSNSAMIDDRCPMTERNGTSVTYTTEDWRGVYHERQQPVALQYIYIICNVIV